MARVCFPADPVVAEAQYPIENSGFLCMVLLGAEDGVFTELESIPEALFIYLYCVFGA